MIKSGELELNKTYESNSEKGVVTLKYIGVRQVVITSLAGNEFFILKNEAYNEWTEISEASHGDEDIMENFDSSSLHRLSYVANLGQLFVTFKSSNEKTYIYECFSECAWEEFKDARSKGKHFARYIQGKYERVIIYPGTQFGDSDDNYGAYCE